VAALGAGNQRQGIPPFSSSSQLMAKSHIRHMGKPKEMDMIWYENHVFPYHHYSGKIGK